MRKQLSAMVVLTTMLLGIPAAAAATPAPGPTGVATPEVASSTRTASITFNGFGFGHGRGMGQYGAYGYALAGESWQWILAHYYGGTTLITAPASVVHVTLDELQGATSVVFIPPKGGSTTVNGKAYSTAVLVGGSGPATCPGVSAAPSGSGDTEVCLPGGLFSRAYKGSFTDSGGTTVNAVSLEDYVAGVVPSESPSSWGTTGGEAALQAQAVAARSYALADGAATTGICDNQDCQVYGGDVVSTLATQYAQAVTTAVTSTAGKVLECNAGSACGPAGSVAFTEYSSSTGGWTAGGTFPAVVDAGDATPTNPNHTWSDQVAQSAISGAFPQIGTFQTLSINSRNGLGALGGRVESMTLQGSAASITVSGDTFANAVGLPSDWFGVLDSVTGAEGGDNGYWILGSDGAVWALGAAPAVGSMATTAHNAPIVGMAVTADQNGYWEVASDGGVFSFGDAKFYGSAGTIHLNQPIVGMAATPDGKGYWLVAADGGIFTYGDAKFYGSAGSYHLNRPIVGMAATPDGKGYWLVATDGGIFSFGDAKFYGSTGAMRLNKPIVGMVPTAGNLGYWLVAQDGGVFTFGNAPFLGSLPGEGLSDSIAGLSPTADGGGYLLVGASGAVYGFGDAPYFGDLTGTVSGFTGSAIGIAAHRG